jgi:hypothetical protein
MNENLQFFICNTTFVEKKTELLFKIKNLGTNNLFLERIKIQQCLVKPGKIFILFSFDKFLEFTDCDKISLKQTKSKALFPVKNFPFCVDSIERQLIIMNGEKVVKIILSKPIQRILNLNFKLPRKKEKINKKRFFYRIRSDLFGKKITILKRKNEIEIFKQNWNFDTFLIKKKIQIKFKKKCSAFNTSQDGNILIFNFSKTVQLWKIFPRVEKFLTKNFDLNGEINHLNFSSKKGKNIAIITTIEEPLFFDTKENILIY